MRIRTFKDLPIGEFFRFESERSMPYSGMARGPWEKISARKYRHLEDVGLVCVVGSVSVLVLKGTGR